jgi:hypothetical protein
MNGGPRRDAIVSGGHAFIRCNTLRRRCRADHSCGPGPRRTAPQIAALNELPSREEPLDLVQSFCHDGPPVVAANRSKTVRPAGSPFSSRGRTATTDHAGNALKSRTWS